MHHFTVDVEDYFHVTALEPWVARSSWSVRNSRARIGVDALLDALAQRGTHATFFVLGWLAEREPGLVHDIAAGGHEVASHGWDHRKITGQSESEFRDSVRRSKELLEDLTGEEVLGYRAPSFSLVPGQEWAFDTLIEEGYRYDSSIFPARRGSTGYPGAERGPAWLSRPAGSLFEVPAATLEFAGMVLPAGGGAYFRLFPYRFVAGALRALERQGLPGTFYIHPWELDPEQPRLPVSLATRVRHYGGLSRVRSRIDRLLGEFEFRPIRDLLKERPATVVEPAASPHAIMKDLQVCVDSLDS